MCYRWILKGLNLWVLTGEIDILFANDVTELDRPILLPCRDKCALEYGFKYSKIQCGSKNRRHIGWKQLTLISFAV